MSKRYSLEELTRITLEVIEDDGLDGYLPTLMVPSKKEIRVIEGIPKSKDHRQAIQEVIRQDKLDKKEFFFGVQSGRNEITTGHYKRGAASFMHIKKSKSGYSISGSPFCKWWRIGAQQTAARDDVKKRGA